MKKLLLTLMLAIGGFTMSFAQDCSDDRDTTHADRVDYIRFNSEGETFVLLRSEESHFADLSGITITHQWAYVKNGNALEVRSTVAQGDILLLTLPNFVGIGAFLADLNTLTKIDFRTYATETAIANGSSYSFD